MFDLDQNKLKILFLVAIFLLFFLFITSTLLNMQQKKQSTNTVNNTSNSTNYLTPVKKTEISTPYPTIEPKDFTGVKEEELPKDVKDYSDQKLSLLKKIPLKLAYFTIDFDYVEDKFTIKYQEPINTAKQLFASWLSQNYPALKISDFIEK
ncbi:MAG: hypothetical protein ACPLRN_00925 [Microgenomates group bacterium]